MQTIEQAAQVEKITISISRQQLSASLIRGGSLHYPIATAKNGCGQQHGSECTPLGAHRIRARIGSGQALNTVYVGRRPTGECFTEDLRKTHPERDWILTRILWLCGNQIGFNRLGTVDTMRRFIYIHGAPDTDPMGVPSSHGCIKMHNADISDLFDRVAVGTLVHIEK